MDNCKIVGKITINCDSDGKQLIRFLNEMGYLIAKKEESFSFHTATYEILKKSE